MDIEIFKILTKNSNVFKIGDDSKDGIIKVERVESLKNTDDISYWECLYQKSCLEDSFISVNIFNNEIIKDFAIPRFISGHLFGFDYKNNKLSIIMSEIVEINDIQKELIRLEKTQIEVIPLEKEDMKISRQVLKEISKNEGIENEVICISIPVNRIYSFDVRYFLED